MLSNLFKLFLSTALIAQPAFAQNAINTSEQFPGINYQRNFVKNPGAEKNKSNITDASAIVTRSTSTPLEGAASFSIDATASAQLVKFDTNTLDNSLKGQNCEAKFVFSGDATLYKAYVEQGSTKVTADLTLTYPTYSQPVSINFPCGDLSANSHLVIESTSSSAAAIKVDTVYTGLATNLGAVAQAQLYGAVVWPGVASCAWSSTSNASFANFAVDSDCTLPSGSGLIANASAPATKIPGISFTSMPPGRYWFTAQGRFKPTTASQSCSWRFSDGANNTTIGMTETDAQAAVSTPSIEGFLDVTSTISAPTFSIQGTGTFGSTACAIDNSVATVGALSIQVFYFPTSSQLALNSNLPSYPTIQTFTSGSGTYTKPAGVQYIRVRMVGGGGGGAGSGSGGGSGTGGGASTFGTTLLSAGGGLGGSLSGGNTGGSSSLGTGPIGTALTGSGGASGGYTNTGQGSCSGGNGGSSAFGGGGIGGGGQGTAQAGSNGSTNTGGGGGGASVNNAASGAPCGGGGGSGGFVDAIISSPSATYAYAVGATGGGGGAGTGGAGGGAGAAGYIEVTEYYSAVPAPLLVGSVTSNSSGTERVERAQISCGSSSTIDSQSGSWISSIGNITSNRCTVTIATGMFSATPICTASYKTTETTTLRGVNLSVASATSFSIGDVYYVSGSAPSASTGTDTWYIICMGPR